MEGSLGPLLQARPGRQLVPAHHVYVLQTLGRAAGCRVIVDDNFVSQIHARVTQRDDQILVEDLGSTNGTYLNRRRVAGPMVMNPGDRLQVGDPVLELR